MKFKRKTKDPVIQKTITILDAETNEVKDVFDIVEEIQEIKLEDESGELGLNDQEIKDLAFVQALREKYKDVKDFEKFVGDACGKASKNLSDTETLTDEEKAAKEKAEKEAKAKIDALGDPDNHGLTDEAKKLAEEQAKKLLEDEEKLQKEIEEAERKKHEAARKY